MSESKLSPEAREAVKAAHQDRLKRIKMMRSEARFRPSPGRNRFSRKGQRRPSYYTKRHTPCRIRELKEAATA